MKTTLLFIIGITLSISSFSQSNVYLKINHLLGASPFAFNTTTTNNLGNTFDVSRMEFYISSLSITHDGGMVTTISNTWILANASTQVYEVLGNYNITAIEKVTFSIGVETPTNHNDPSLFTDSHPLAPKSPSMHWGWSAGYRFIAMEGMAGTSSANQMYQLHGLGDVNYFSQTILTAGTTDANGLVIELNADYEQALKDINVASGVISHGEANEAKKMMENFRDYVFTSIEGNSPVGVAEIGKKSQFSIYPNPSKYGNRIVLNYNGDVIGLSVEILDLSGRLIKNVALENNSLTLNNLEKGIYLLNIKSEAGNVIETQKLIVTND
jgi:hypothetical protein